MVKTLLTFLNSYYELIANVTRITKKVFLTFELKDKLVNNLNYTIERLNGKNWKDLKLRNKEEFKFDPKGILKSIIEVYLNFIEHADFLQTIVSDERSFSLELFEKTMDILERKNLIPEDEVEGFKNLYLELKVYWDKKQRDDNILKSLTDIPEEFIDPITSEIMQDPVKLPSGNVVDRITIIKHLLSDDTDPFNRQKLTREMLVPEEELKARIKAFLDEKLGK
jgi:ubiquitin conjugation factor E4 B